MNIFDPHISGSLSVSGSGEISGDLRVLGTISGSIKGDGSQLFNIPSSGVTGLNLTRIADGSATASISSANGLVINTNTEITGTLKLNKVNLGGNDVVEITVTDAGGKYFINGVRNPRLSFIRGFKYKFLYSNFSQHPFKFSITDNGTHNGGTEYTTGVTMGYSPDYIQIEVTDSTPSTLHYFCGFHVGMGNSISVYSDFLNGQSSINLTNVDTGMYATTGSNNFTNIQRTSGSLVVTGSVDVTGSINLFGTANISGSIMLNGQAIGTGKLDETTFNSYTSSNDSRVSFLESSTGSLNTFTSSIDTTIKNKLNTETVISGSIQVILTGTTGYSTFSSSISTSIGSLSSSVATTTSGLSSSIDTISSSVATTTSGLSSSIGSLSSSVATTTLGLSSSLSSSIESLSSSVATTTLGLSSSLSSSIGSLSSSVSTTTSGLSSSVGSLSSSVATTTLGLSSSLSSSIGSLSSSVATTTTGLTSTITSLSSSIATTTLGLSSSLSSSIESLSSSVATTTLNIKNRVDSIETSTGSLNSFTSSINTTIKTKLDSESVISGSIQVNITSTTGYSTFSSSIATTTNDLSSSVATTTSGLTLSISSLSSSAATTTLGLSSSIGSLSSSVATTTLTTKNRVDSIEAKTGSYATTGSNIFQGNQTITGSLYISQDLIVAGSSSIQNISSSVLNIGDNIITVNALNPSVRFGGLAVIDSGSSPQVSGSMLFDSVNNQWLFVHQDQASVTSSVLLMGPETYNNLGGEAYLTLNRIPKGTGIEHLNDSNITDNGTKVSINSNTEVTGTLKVTGVIGGPTITAIETSTSSLNTFTSSLLTAIELTGSNLTVRGDFLVKGTTTNVNTATLNVDNNLINLNGNGASFAGIRIKDTTAPSQISGSLLWDAANDYWIAGQLGSEQRLVRETEFNNAVTRIGNVETSTGSLNSFTSSINTTIKNKLNSDGVISSSVQVNHNTTTNYEANQHIDHTTVSISAGNGLSGGGTIAATRTLTLDTGSVHFLDGVKKELNTEGVISGSSQVLSGTGIFSGSAQLPSGLVSGSSQVLAGTTIHSGSFFNGISVVSGSAQISFNGITDKPTLVSGSAQISFNSITDKPALVSGSSQITFLSISSIPSGLVSGSSQVLSGTGIWSGSAQLPSGVISGSAQVVSSLPAGTISGSAQLTSTFVQKSGDTMTGQLIVGSTGTAGAATLKVNTSSAISFIHSQENFSPNMTAGQTNILVVGQAGNTKNAGYLGYNWSSSASNDNFISLGHWGSDNLLRVYGNGNVFMGTVTTGVWNGTAIGDAYISSGTNWNTAYNKRISTLGFTSSTVTITLADATTVTASVPTFNQNTSGTAANITASSNTSLTSLANLATVGTIGTGVWNGSSIATTYTAAKVTAVNQGTGVSVDTTTGSVTVSIGQSVATSANVTFGSITGTVTASGNGDSNAPFKFSQDYSGWMSIVAGTAGSANGWGLYWAGESGTLYGTNQAGAAGNIWSNSSNPNEYVFVGNGVSVFSVYGNSGHWWSKGNGTVAGTLTVGGSTAKTVANSSYSTTFSSVSSVTVTHSLGTKDVAVFVYDSSDNMFWPSSIVTTSTSVVTITFSSSRSGRVVVVR